MQSRYYDSEICRFIDADGYVSTGQGILGNNMFAYCNNNPVMGYDPTGEYCVANKDEADTNYLDDWLIEGAGVSGGSIGGFGGGNSVATNVGSDYGYAGIARINISTAVCFVEGTIIKTATGDTQIEQIDVGEYVYAHDPETKLTELKAVVNTFVNEATELVHIFVGGEEIICTNEHPFYSPIKGWTAACKLRAGDILVTLNGNYIVVERVQHEILESPIKVYNFEVEDFHTYFVGSSNGLLVHNSCNHNSSWTSERRSYWKTMSITNELDHDYGSYIATQSNIERMSKGLAPIGWDGYSVHLHHWLGITNDFYNYSAVSRTLHILLHSKR